MHTISTMSDKKYTNGNLAQDFFALMSPRYRERRYFRLRDAIRCVACDLPSYYHEHGTLKGLQINGFGRMTFSALELLLEYGPSEASVRLDAMLHIKNSSARCSLPENRVRDGSDDPSWHNVVNAFEEQAP